MDDNRRLAFICGSNGPAGGHVAPLRHARSDARRLAAVLEGPWCGFKVVTPESSATVEQVLRQLEATAEFCRPHDEFICYFSGHGVLLNGTLLLLWDNTELDNAPLGTAIPISRLITALSFCRASNRLLILDCCHAGAAASAMGLKSAAGRLMDDMGTTSSNHLILMASDRLERAREFDHLGGSFMTTSLCQALTHSRDLADVDRDGNVSVQDLAAALATAAHAHNATHPSQSVPVPYLAGQLRGPFHLVRRPRWPRYKLSLPDGGTATLLPYRREPRAARAANDWTAIADYPVTNRQYRSFIASTGGEVPQGQRFVDGQWRGPFRPWADDEFNRDDQPVVCVDADQARSYCHWFQRSLSDKQCQLTDPSGRRTDARIVGVDLPSVSEWECAAFGHTGEWRTQRWLRGWDWADPATWRHIQATIHHKASATANSTIDSSRQNPWGISDLLGNVWEWCYSSYARGTATDALIASIDGMPRFGDFRDRDFALRGGGFLDDVTRIVPALNSAELADGMRTRHSDLGFRVALTLRLDSDSIRALANLAHHIPDLERSLRRSLPRLAG